MELLVDGKLAAQVKMDGLRKSGHAATEVNVNIEGARSLTFVSDCQTTPNDVS